MFKTYDVPKMQHLVQSCQETMAFRFLSHAEYFQIIFEWFCSHFAASCPSHLVQYIQEDILPSLPGCIALEEKAICQKKTKNYIYIHEINFIRHRDQ